MTNYLKFLQELAIRQVHVCMYEGTLEAGDFYAVNDEWPKYPSRWAVIRLPNRDIPSVSQKPKLHLLFCTG
jgi:hypothetical protein